MSQNFHCRQKLHENTGGSWSRVAFIFLLFICAGALTIFLRKGNPPEAPLTTQTSAQPETAPDPAPEISTTSPQPSSSVPASPSPSLNRPSASLATTAHAEPTPYSRQLVAGLQLTGPLTADRAAEWKTNFLQLVEQGAVAVPAIQEFLEKNTDVVFGQNGSQALGYDSLRKAMFDVLQQIGGPEAVSAMTGVLQTTAGPKEIALLAKNLAQQDAEQYRGVVLSAVHEALTMAANKNLEGSDVAPLFEVLQKYGGAEAVSQLQQAGKQWNYYAAIALAQLPEGAGIPTLIQIARDGTFANTTALEMITQAAPQYPDARAALLEMARASKIAPSQWPYLTSLLAGEQFHYQDSAFDASNNRTPEGAAHVLFGNQHFFTAPPEGGLTPEQISQQTALIDELLALTSEPAAANALKEAKELLSKRPPQTAAVGK